MSWSELFGKIGDGKMWDKDAKQAHLAHSADYQLYEIIYFQIIDKSISCIKDMCVMCIHAFQKMNISIFQ